ncbi:hypothetical protein K431DRAFT_281935 [Polychaeton citri CBS 116435]|uniref:Uncharacterized protein n=1 Tax=Polychaeton citri CBS 116435 TaxID=1314669 RepID=A0A9P4QE14_9PEZI|nr:hypothetical protein K431DRAFT_281935 [Polychaeton citri CBS 116435]
MPVRAVFMINEDVSSQSFPQKREIRLQPSREHVHEPFAGHCSLTRAQQDKGYVLPLYQAIMLWLQ